jgi:hypothetical protein
MRRTAVPARRRWRRSRARVQCHLMRTPYWWLGSFERWPWFLWYAKTMLARKRRWPSEGESGCELSSGADPRKGAPLRILAPLKYVSRRVFYPPSLPVSNAHIPVSPPCWFPRGPPYSAVFLSSIPVYRRVRSSLHIRPALRPAIRSAPRLLSANRTLTPHAVESLVHYDRRHALARRPALRLRRAHGRQAARQEE